MPEKISSENKVYLLDPSALETIRELQAPTGNDLLKQIFDIYLEETPKQLDALRQAAAQQDATGLSQVAHSMKSSSTNIGATELSKICAVLEKKARENNLKTITTDVSDLGLMAQQVLDEIEQVWLKKMS